MDGGGSGCFEEGMYVNVCMNVPVATTVYCWVKVDRGLIKVLCMWACLLCVWVYVCVDVCVDVGVWVGV